MNKGIVTSLVLAASVCSVFGDIQLPSPRKRGGKDMMEVFAERKSARDFSEQELSLKTLSDLLWAANGINRPDGHRTAPTGMNVQDIDVYVMLPSGVYIYDAKANLLKLVNSGDHRAVAGKQDFAQKAPLNLFYVQDRSRTKKADEAGAQLYAGVHSGAIMQNVYLYCANAGLISVARAFLDYEACSKALKLGAEQRLVLGQSVGYPSSDGYIGKKAALDVAFKHSGVAEADARRVSCKLDRDDGVMVYEIEFKNNGFEYDYEINAKSGKILESSKERD